MKILLLIAALFLILPVVARAATNYYVDVAKLSGNCSDTYPGSLSQPFCTVTKALSLAQPGTSIYLRAGNYPSFDVTVSGASGNYLTIQNYNNEKVYIQAGGSSDGIAIRGSSYVKVIGLDVSGATGNYGAGINVTTKNGVFPNNNIIQNNIVHDNMGMHTIGIFVQDGSYNQILDNTVYHSYDTGIWLISHSNISPNGITGNVISGNTAYANTGDPPNADGIGLSGPGTTNTQITHNISYGNGDDGFDTWDSPGNYIAFNLAYGNGVGGDGNGIKAGSNTTGGKNTLVANIAHDNPRDGFETNGGWGNKYYNNYAYNNGKYGFEDAYRNVSCDVTTCPSVYINNIGYNNTGANFSAYIYTAASHNNLWFTPTKGANVLYNYVIYSTLASFYAASGNRLDNPANGLLSSLSAEPYVNTANAAGIDKGDPANPAQLPVFGSYIDIGPYEYQSTTIIGDINGDGHVNLLDYSFLSAAFGTNNAASDLNHDGIVNLLDFSLLSQNFGR